MNDLGSHWREAVIANHLMDWLGWPDPFHEEDCDAGSQLHEGLWFTRRALRLWGSRPALWAPGAGRGRAGSISPSTPELRSLKTRWLLQLLELFPVPEWFPSEYLAYARILYDWHSMVALQGLREILDLLVFLLFTAVSFIGFVLESHLSSENLFFLLHNTSVLVVKKNVISTC